jgi:hypothetical protein
VLLLSPNFNKMDCVELVSHDNMSSHDYLSMLASIAPRDQPSPSHIFFNGVGGGGPIDDVLRNLVNQVNAMSAQLVSLSGLALVNSNAVVDLMERVQALERK